MESLDDIVVRERAVYEIHCRAILIDLREKARNHPDLVADSYFLTQSVGKRVQAEGHPGLLVPSARCKGSNLAAFKPEILSDPRNYCYLTYCYDPRKRSVRVERTEGETLIEIRY